MELQPLVTVMTDGTLQLASSTTVGELLAALDKARQIVLAIQINPQAPEASATEGSPADD